MTGSGLETLIKIANCLDVDVRKFIVQTKNKFEIKAKKLL